MTTHVPARLIGCVLAACAALPAAAEAAVISQEGTTLVYSAAGGERNSPRIVPRATNTVTVQESGTTPLASRTAARVPRSASRAARGPTQRPTSWSPAPRA